MNIIWFKRDLRIDDQPALTRGFINPEKTMAIFIFEPELWQQPDISFRHFEFCRQCVSSLQYDLRRLGIELHIFIDEAIQVFQFLHKTFGLNEIHSCQETWNYWTYDRDTQIHQWTKKNQITWLEYPQNGVIRRLKSRDGWAKQWTKFMHTPLNPPPQSFNHKVPIHPLPSASEFGLAIEDNHHFQPGGQKFAQQLLTSFLNHRGQFYTKTMSSPITAFNDCSRLSPHIAFGSISLRRIYQSLVHQQQKILSMLAGESKKQWLSAFRSFGSRLRWHCHFIQKLEDDPNIEFRSLHSMYRPFDQKDFNQTHFNRWKKGQTGYPLIDACMRALKQCGWLNFRMRAMVMSFAAHHLQLPWQSCALYLATQFTDYEPGIHYSQCQMQSGVTGINTIRIYNPIKQSYDQDPNGTFIREWCPELDHIPINGIHEPWHYGMNKPIVEETIARRHASDQLYQIRKSPTFDIEANLIQKQHG
ncbi:MAG: FAD-binding domain-containing protein, partial [Candidatus Margulisiibacteriota bacterium]